MVVSAPVNNAHWESTAYAHMHHLHHLKYIIHTVYPGTPIICNILPQISCSYNCDDIGCTVPSSSLCRLHHLSPIWIIIHHMYILCTSFHRTTFQTTMF